MKLYQSQIRPGNEPLPESVGWGDVKKLPEEACVVRISTAPTGRPHPASMCEVYDSQWRQCMPQVLAALLGSAESREALFVWVEGPMETGFLPQVLARAFAEDERGHMRYHLEGITSLLRDGYYYNWVCIEFSENALAEILADEFVCFEIVRLSALLFDDTLVPDVIIQKSKQVVTPRWAVEHNAIAVKTSGYFEGCYLAGREVKITEALRRIDSAIGLIKA